MTPTEEREARDDVRNMICIGLKAGGYNARTAESVLGREDVAFAVVTYEGRDYVITVEPRKARP